MLTQKDDQNRERAIAFGGRSLRPNENNWTISEIECLSIISGIKEYHCYLAGKPFNIVSDHVALSFIKSLKLSKNSRLTRWSLFLQMLRVYYLPSKREVIHGTRRAVKYSTRTENGRID